MKVAIYLTILAIPLAIAYQYHWLPDDDALRHAAKAVSGRPWSEILMLRDDVGSDQHPGWHALLAAVHHRVGGDAGLLALFSCMGLFILFTLTPVPALRRPEAWILALLIATVVMPDLFILRIMRGRPYILSMSVLLALLLLGRAPRIYWGCMLMITALIAAATCMHSTWYMFLLLPLAYALAGERRRALVFLACWVAGILLGAALTGHPFAYLTQQIRLVALSLGGGVVYRQLVTEFYPLSDSWPSFILLGAVFLTKKGVCGEWPSSPRRNPLLILTAMAWVLGLRVYRFWGDWGYPTLLLWTALELEPVLDKLVQQPRDRALACLALCGALFIGTTADRDGRWSSTDAGMAAKDATNQTSGPKTSCEVARDDWLPGTNGVVYSDSMGVFYTWFLRNPTAPWRYVLGYEPGLMPPEDLKIFRNIQYQGHHPSTYQPWVQKMRPIDRMVILSSSKPEITGLEWQEYKPGTWIGRR